MSSRLLAIATAGLACSSHAAGPQEIARLPIDLPEPSVTRHAEGWVTGADKKPLPGALVSVIDLRSYRGIGFSVSDRSGRFSVDLPSTPVVVTATANGHVAADIAPTASNQLSFALAGASGAAQRFAGTVVDATGQPLARVRVRLMHWSWPVGDAFYTTSDNTGRFQFSVSTTDTYDLMVDDPRYISNFAPWLNREAGDSRLIAYTRDWVRAQANRVDESVLGGLCAPLTRDGVRQLAGSLRDARAVGLGESTHGTREFTELRSRLVEELIRQGWLTTIALEASWEEVARLDDYVRRGAGTGRDAVTSLAYWPWRTEEFLAFVESVRKLNDELPPDKKIEFMGLDYAPPGKAANAMRRYFEREGAAHQDVLSRLDPLHRIINWLEVSKLSREKREAMVRTLEALSRIAEDQPSVSLAMAQGLLITKLILESHGNGDDFRDPVMAEAALALLARSDKERRIAIWAHSGHLAQGPIEGAVPMGQYLRTRLAKRYRAIGSMFYDGSFRTYSGLQKKMVDHAVALPPAFFFESVMHRVSPSDACVLDVTAAAQNPALRDWLSVPKHVRIYGGLEISESYPWPPVVVPDLWSAMIFVPSTAPTTPLD